MVGFHILNRCHGTVTVPIEGGEGMNRNVPDLGADLSRRLKSRSLIIAAIVTGGMVVFYTLVFGPVSSYGVGGKDWVESFRAAFRGDFSLVVTPYWSLFLSYLPSRLPPPLGYGVWIGVGGLLILATSAWFESPLFGVIASFQFNWVLFYGQIDPFVAFGIALGDYASRYSRPLLVGVALALLSIKPQIGLLVGLIFLYRSTNRLTSALAFLSVVVASMLVWPGWPAWYFTNQLSGFLEQPSHLLANTSLGLPIWLSVPIAVSALLVPLEGKKKLQVLVSTNLLISPYSTIYSQLSLLTLGLPWVFYLFGLFPWAVAVWVGPLGHWQWGFVVPSAVLVYGLASSPTARSWQRAFKDRLVRSTRLSEPDGEDNEKGAFDAEGEE